MSELVDTVPDDNAFPHFNSRGEVLSLNNGGLTKREYFAALALQGRLASGNAIPQSMTLAELAVSYADQLIIELNQPRESAETKG